MIVNYIYLIFLAGIIVAVFQDLKRREVDNWLTIMLIVISGAFLIFSYFESDTIFHLIIFLVSLSVMSMFFFFDFESLSRKSKAGGYSVIILFFVFVVSLLFGLVAYFGNNMPPFILATSAFCVMFLFANIFYFGRVFGGGDAQLMFSMSIFFILGIVAVKSFEMVFINILTFLILLIMGGSVYGLLYTSSLFIKNFSKVFAVWKRYFKKWIIVSSIICLVFFSILGFVWAYFFAFAILSILFPVVYFLGKSLEEVTMVKKVLTKDLREGDWLSSDVIVGKSVVKSDFNGVTEGEILLLKKKKKFVYIKDGIPYVPAFLIAIILYAFFRDWFVELFWNVFSYI